MKRFLLFFYGLSILLAGSVTNLLGQQTHTSFNPPARGRGGYSTPPPSQPSYREERVWVAGHWHFDRSCGRRVWVPGYWQTRPIIIVNPPPVVAPAPVIPSQGCAYPTLSPQELEEAVYALRSRSFESSRLALAKEIIGSHCLSAAQVRDFMLQFAFESSRLEVARFAFGFTVDRQNYYIVHEAFQYPESIAQLQQSLAWNRRQGY